MPSNCSEMIWYCSCDFLGFFFRERKMRTNFFRTDLFLRKLFWHNSLNTPRGPGRPGKIPGTSQIPLFEIQGRQTFEGGHKLFGHRPLRVEDPHPTWQSPDPKVNLCALFSCLIQALWLLCVTMGAKRWTQTFYFSNFSGVLGGISRQNPGISRPK